MDLCAVDDCERAASVKSAGLCRKHYMRMWRKGSTDETRKNARGLCTVDGCDRPHQALGLCYTHWKSQNRRVAILRQKTDNPRTCGYCGELVNPARQRRGAESFCSRTCKTRAWVESGKAAVSARKSYFKSKYGLTVEQVETMAAAGCAICGTVTWTGRHARPHVDHCHDTGQVRGILCSECNTGLGKFREDPARLRRALVYLEAADYVP